MATPEAARHAARSTESLRRQRQSESVVLAQIVGRAIRLRAASETGEASLVGDTTSTRLTLIELIQASTAVFEKLGIRAPEDAAFHRHLLALSMDPEPDWEKKIKRFAVKRVTKRSTKGSESVLSPRAVSVGSVTRTVAATLDTGVKTSLVRRRSGIGSRDGSLTRRIAPGSPSAKAASKRQYVDRFSDIVASPAWHSAPDKMKLKENQVRNASASTRADATTETDGGDVREKLTTPAQKLKKLEAIRSKLNDITEELAIEGGDNEDVDQEDGKEIDQELSDASREDLVAIHIGQESDTLSESAPSVAPHNFHSLPERLVAPLVSIQPPQIMTEKSFRLLATVFQQWREITKFQRLVHESRQRELRLTQAVMPPIATFAILRWILLTLPERNDLTSRRHDSKAVLSYGLRRGITVENPPLLRHFTGRLLVWTAHRILKCWAVHARAVKVTRIKSLLRERTNVLETASECLYRWRKHSRKRRRVGDHGIWLETLHGRRQLRASLHIWRQAQQTQCRVNLVRDKHVRKNLKLILCSWNRLAVQRQAARALGARRMLKRVIRAWHTVVDFSDREQQLLRRAYGHFAGQVVRSSWSSWRIRVSAWKRKRLKFANAAKSNENKIKQRVWKAWTKTHARIVILRARSARFLRRREMRMRRSILTQFFSYVHHKRSCALLVTDCTARRERRIVKTVWRHWQQHFEAAVRNDEKLTQEWESQRRRQLWSIWKKGTNIMKLSITLRSFFHESVLRNSWRSWIAWAKKERNRRNLLREWRGEREMALKREVLDALLENTKAGRVQHIAVQAFLSRCTGFRLQAFVYAWRKFAKARRENRHLDVRIIGICKAGQLKNAWVKWRKAFHMARCVHLADHAMGLGLRRRSFNCWSRIFRSRRRYHTLERELHCFRLHRAILMWKSRLERKRKWRHQEKNIRDNSGATFLLRGWKAWRSQFFEAKKRHEKVKRAVLQWQNRLLELFFSEWRDVIGRRKHLRKLLVQWWKGTDQKNVRACWIVWRDYVLMKHTMSRYAKQARQFYDQKILRKAIEKWRCRCKYSQEKLKILQRCADKWKSNQQRKVFSRWIEYARLRTVVRSMSVQTDRRRQERTFFNWKKWRAIRLAAATEQKNAALILRDWQVRRAIKRLRLRAQLSKRMASIRSLVVLAGSRGLLTAFFRIWKTFVTVVNGERLLAARYAAHMLHFRQCQSIRRWERFTRMKRLLSTTLLKALARSSSSLTQRVFGKWHQYVSQRRISHALKEKAIVFQVFCLLPAYFHAWRRFVNSQTHKQQVMLKASQLLYHQREAKALKCWMNFTDRNKRVRKAVKRWQNQCLTQRFNRWKAFKQAQRKDRIADHHFQMTRSLRVMRAWAKETRRQRLLRHFSTIWRAQTIENCFGSWKKHVHIAKSAHGILRRLHNGSLSRIFNSWKGFIDSQSLQSGRIRDRFALLWSRERKMTSFQRWKALADKQKLLRRQVLRRMHQHVGLCYQRWVSVVARKKKLVAKSNQVVLIDQKRLVNETWRFWRREKVSRDAIRKFRKRILNQSTDSLARLIVSTWRQWTVKIASAKALQHRNDQQTTGRVLCAWKNMYVRRRRQERSIAATIRKAYEAVLVRRVLLRMRARLTIKKACTAVILPQLQRHAVISAWRAWLHFHARKLAAKQVVLTVRGKVSQSKRAIRETARICVLRWRSLNHFHVFVHWYAVASSRKWIRTQTMEAVHAWQIQRSMRSFVAWRHLIDNKKRKRTIRTSGERHRQIRTWKRWLQFHQKLRYRSDCIAQAVKLRAKIFLIPVMLTWKNLVLRRRRLLLLAASITLRRTHRAVHKWHVVAVDRKSYRLQLTVARVAFHQRCISSVWLQWVTFVQQVKTHRLELQHHTERLQILILCSAFRAWHAWSHRQRKIGHILRMLTSRCDSKSARQVLNRWSRYTQTKKSRRSAASQFAYEQGVRRGIQAMRSNAVDARTKREGVCKAREWIEVLQGRWVTRSFRRWTAFAALAKQTRAVVRRYQLTRLLPAVFFAWRSFARKKLAQGDRLERAVGCWRSISARRAWNAWVAFHRRKSENRSRGVKASCHHQCHLLRAILLAWGSTVMKKKLLGETCRRLIVRWKLQTAFRCFTRWQSHFLRSKSSRVSSVIVASRQAGVIVRAAWGKWRLQFVVCRVGQRKRLTRYWTAWSNWRDEKRHWQDFQTQQTLLLLRTVRVRHRICRWKRFVVQAKLSKTMSLLSTRFSKETMVKRCFERWLQFLIVHHKEKEKMKKVLAWLRNRQLVVVFQALCGYAEQSHTKKRDLQRAISYASRKCQRLHLTAWHHITSVVKAQRDKLHRYVSIMQHVSQRKSFAAWRDFAWKRRQLRHTYVTLMSQRWLVTSQTVFHAWKAFVVKSKRNYLAKSFHESALNMRSFQQWRRYVVLSRIERMIGASEQRVLELAFVSWRKRAILNQNVRRLGETKREENRVHLQRSHFDAWRSWTRIRTKCSSLLANVAVGNHLRFRFLMWKQFYMQRKRLKWLIGSASNPREASNDGVELTESSWRQLARKARFFQRYEVAWEDIAVVWRRWRHLFHASLFFRIRRLHRVYSAWRRWSQRRVFIRDTLRSCHITNRLTIQRRVLRQWREVVATVKRIQRERRRERELWVIVNAEILRHERKTLQRHWTAWRERTEDKRHLLVSVDSYQRARVLTKFWLLWSHDFVNAARIQWKDHVARVGQLNILKARRAVSLFNSNRTWRLRVRRVVRFVSSYRESRWCRVCFDQWRAFGDTRRRARLLCIFKKRQLVQRVFRAWKAELELQRQHHRDFEAFVYRRLQTLRLRTLSCWIAYVLRRRRSEDATAVATAFRLQKCIHTRWLGFLLRRKTIRDKRDRVETSLTMWKKRRTVDRWHTNAHNTLLMRKLRGFVLKKHLAAWKLYLQVAIADHWRVLQLQKRMALALRYWKGKTRTKRQLQFMQQEFRDRRAVRRARWVLLRWHEVVEYAKRKVVARNHYESVLKFKSFLRWYDAARAASAHSLSQLVLAKEYSSFRVKRRVLRRWTSAVRASTQRRAVLLTCVVKLQRCFLSRLQQVVLRAWADAADREQYTRECALLLQRRRAARSLRNWRRQIANRRRHERLERDALAYRRNRLLSIVFFHWQNYALAWKDAERLRSRRPASVRPNPLPPAVVVHNSDSENDEDSNFRRPLSPVRKRFLAKQNEKQLAGSLETEPRTLTPSLSDAATLSLDVKKRLLLLGQWKPSQRSLAPR